MKVTDISSKEAWPTDLAGFKRPVASGSVAMILNYGETGSKPLHVISSDSKEYWIKTRHNPHGQESLLAETICYSVGDFLGAPVPRHAFIQVPYEVARDNSLHDAYPLHAGLAFGSEVIHGVTEHRTLRFLNKDDNPRHAAAFIALWEWCDGADEQFLYRTEDDYSLVTFDYGFWLGIEGQWNIDYFSNRPGHFSKWSASLKQVRRSAFNSVARKVSSITVSDALKIVAAVPVELGYSDKELIEAAQWLYSRKEVIERSMLIHASNAGKE